MATAMPSMPSICGSQDEATAGDTPTAGPAGDQSSVESTRRQCSRPTRQTPAEPAKAACGSRARPAGGTTRRKITQRVCRRAVEAPGSVPCRAVASDTRSLLPVPTAMWAVVWGGSGRAPTAVAAAEDRPAQGQVTPAFRRRLGPTFVGTGQGYLPSPSTAAAGQAGSPVPRPGRCCRRRPCTGAPSHLRDRRRRANRSPGRSRDNPAAATRAGRVPR